MNAESLGCLCTLEYLNAKDGLVARKLTYKTCTLRLVRNEFREMFMEVSSENSTKVVRHQLKNLNVHKKFMNEGKASIMFQDDKLNVYISNAPPSQLFTFLKLMTVKIIGGDSRMKSAREKLLSSKPPSVEDISPLTDKDVEAARAKLNVDKTTPKGVVKTMKRELVDRREVKAKKNCLRGIVEQVLCEEQRMILEAAKSGCSLFFTGSAGTGKSHLLRSIIAALPPDVTYATASTGVAACHIGGTTLHQFAGVGAGDGSFERCVELASRPLPRAVWRQCRHLVIDEISMVHAELFDKLEHVARVVRRSDRPFGGIQLILCGDFFQLPPVSTSVKFCFQARSWERCIARTFELRTVHRQSDPVLIDILQSVRIGRVTEEMSRRLLATEAHRVGRDGIRPTRLCTHTADASAINTKELGALKVEAKTYRAVDTPAAHAALIEKQSPVPGTVSLKIGAQVMLMKNVDVARGLVNGARGVILRFEGDLPVVQFTALVHRVQREKFVSKTASGVVVSRVQIPLTLAWAFSIHKAQGLTLDCAEMSLARVFAAGHAYVALSRVKSLDSLRITDFDPKQIWANAEVLKYYQKFRRRMQALQIVPLGRKI